MANIREKQKREIKLWAIGLVFMSLIGSGMILAVFLKDNPTQAITLAPTSIGTISIPICLQAEYIAFLKFSIVGQNLSCRAASLWFILKTIIPLRIAEYSAIISKKQGGEYG